MRLFVLAARHSASLLLVLAAAAASGCASAPAARNASANTLTAAAAPGGPLDIAYRIAMAEPASHLYDVQIDVRGALPDDTLRLDLPVWSPGRYARVDFARNVQRFSAEDGAGNKLAWMKTGGSRWQVAGAGQGTVRVRYQVYANTLSGTYSVLDTAHANWNGAGIFMYVTDHKPDPVRLTIAPPAGWRVMNGDVAANAPARGDTAFRFENYDRLVDTPTEVAPGFMLDTFRVDGQLYRSMVHHNGPASPVARQRFVQNLQRIVQVQNRVIRPPPLETYTFLFNLGYAGGDGMEHLYSTEVISSQRWSDTATVLAGISTASHEYFHTWNVKRLRPAALGPFDYTQAQHQPSLWVAEGWTQYYGDMTLHRADIISKPAMYALLANRIRYVSESPGRTERSARQASFDAPFFDGGVEPMETNENATFVTYYYQGEVLAMLLDLEIRSRSGNARSLDDVLRLLVKRTWEQPNTSYYLQGRGYTEADVERAVSDVAGADFRAWFEKYVGGVEPRPWTETLALAGLTLSTVGGQYAIAESPTASAAQRRVRDGWLRGETGAASAGAQ